MALELIVIAIIAAALSGFPGVLLPRSSIWGQRLAVVVMLASLALGLIGTTLTFVQDQTDTSVFLWPAMGNGLIGIDALSAWFLCPVLLIGGLGAWYGLGYWPQPQHQGNGRKLSLFWGLMVAGMSLLIISRHALVFLLGWEIMALAAFFLVSTEDKKKASRQAGFIYLVATHIGTLTLFGMFVLWHWATGSYDLVPVTGTGISLDVLNILFFMALLGFGLKAGVMPLHFWLPGAHANAPTHVSAILSGVVLKMGIYGLVRFLFLLPDPPIAWGAIILTLGAISGLLGVVFAIAQHDLKRLLAYHSVENIGIILLGLGLALIGLSTHQPVWFVLGMAGCLLHVWNHSLFKSLLFFGAGSVIHARHTQRIDRLGGLAKTMPLTALMFLIGAIAICGLPPLNGFISELFIYLGLFRAITDYGSQGLAIALVVPVLAMIGALALACFVKVYGAVFLGSARTPSIRPAHESPLTMALPMLIIAVVCLVIGVGPVLLIPTLDALISQVNLGQTPLAISIGAVSPLKTISPITMVLLGAILAASLLMWLYRRAKPSVPTWDCGYAQPTARMQYTASSLALSITGLFNWVLKIRQNSQPPDHYFPTTAQVKTHIDDPVLDRMLLPGSRRITRIFAWFHRFQQGLTQYYIAYILIALIIILGSLIPFQEIWTRLLAR